MTEDKDKPAAKPVAKAKAPVKKTAPKAPTASAPNAPATPAAEPQSAGAPVAKPPVKKRPAAKSAAEEGTPVASVQPSAAPKTNKTAVMENAAPKPAPSVTKPKAASKPAIPKAPLEKSKVVDGDEPKVARPATNPSQATTAKPTKPKQPAKPAQTSQQAKEPTAAAKPSQPAKATKVEQSTGNQGAAEKAAQTPAAKPAVTQNPQPIAKPVAAQMAQPNAAEKKAATQGADVVAKPAAQPIASATTPTIATEKSSLATAEPVTHPVFNESKATHEPAQITVETNPVSPEPTPTKATDKLAKAVTGTGAFNAKLPHYIRLMRLDKPIGILLLLWPTLWALWLAAKGTPSVKNLAIFSLGVVVMRSAGCVINDFADRKIDGRVARTQGRPLATGALTSNDAIVLFIGLCLLAFGLVLLTDPLTIKLSVGGLVLAFCYPFMKRHTHLPQVVLGAAFAWGVPMAYAAETGKLDKNMWLIYMAVVLWTVVYDTFYAMVDREDDLKIGVKSTAILFGEQDRVITGALQLMVLYALVLVGKAYTLGWVYYLGLTVSAGLFGYQQWLIRQREHTACFKAFLNNNWVGAAVFVGIAVDLAIR